MPFVRTEKYKLASGATDSFLVASDTQFNQAEALASHRRNYPHLDAVSCWAEREIQAEEDGPSAVNYYHWLGIEAESL